MTACVEINQCVGCIFIVGDEPLKLDGLVAVVKRPFAINGQWGGDGHIGSTRGIVRPHLDVDGVGIVVFG